MVSKKELFVRPASGLIREIDTLRASFFNIYSSVGYAPGMVIAIMSTFPLTLILGIPLYSWGMVVSAIFMAIFGVCFIVLASAMPRSGGDYVWTSRIMHPFLGYIEAWFFVIAATFGVMAFNGWAAANLFGSNFASLALMPGGEGWMSLVSTLTSPDGLLVTATIMFIITALIVIVLSAKSIHTLLTAIAIVSCVLMLIPIFGTIGASTDVFKTNLARAGISYENVIASAREAGWPGQESFTWPNFNLILVWGLWSFLGFQLSTYHAGELKGKIARNATIAIFAGLIGALLANAVWPLYFYNLAGAEFTHAWGYLFWNVPESCPFSQPPYPTLIASIARPELAILFWVAGLGILVGFNFVIMSAYLLTGARLFFAMSIDRMLPSSLSDVNPRLHSPVKLMLVLILGGFIFFLLSNRGLWSPLDTAWFMTLGWFATWVFPGLNTILLPYRRPDLYESVPSIWKKKIGPLHISTLLGIVWTAFISIIYINSVFYPLLQEATGATEPVSFAISSGTIAIAVLLVLITIGYLVGVWYNRKKGIDVSMTFKTIPPD